VPNGQTSYGMLEADDCIPPLDRESEPVKGRCMAVFFVFRSHYDEPSGKHLARFKDDAVLDWFRNHWAKLSDDNGACEGLYPSLPYVSDCLVELFQAAYQEDLAAPESDEQLEQYLREHITSEVTILRAPHLLTIRIVDECNMESCYYIFDDFYLAEHRDRAAFLLRKGWKLPGRHSRRSNFEPTEPTEALVPSGGGSGTTWFVILYYDYVNEGNLTELWGPSRIDGLRVPDLASWLCPAETPAFDDPFLLLLRSRLCIAPFTSNPLEEAFRQALLGVPVDDAEWRVQAQAAWRAYCDWLQEQQDRPVGLLFLEQAFRSLSEIPVAHLPDGAEKLFSMGPIGRIRQELDAMIEKDPPGECSDDFPNPALCQVHVTEHLAQLCLNTEHWRSFRRAELFHQWIFFDDLWASAHPTLANAILRYARCWDVLSPDGPHDSD
jgi:hypothetical protein